MRMGGERINVNRRGGVYNYLAHMGTTDCDAAKGLSTVMMKPYPKSDTERPSRQMVERWNDENPIEAAPGIGECPQCHKYLGKCPYCHRPRPTRPK